MTRELAATTFDYSQIEDQDVRGKMVAHEGRVLRLKGGVVKSVLDLGEELCLARETMANQGNGVFQKWVEVACGFGKSSAYNYMAAWQTFKDCPTVGRIEDTAMYRLAESDTPKRAVTEAKKLADKGVNVTAKLAKELIEKHQRRQPEPEPEPELIDEQPQDEPAASYEPEAAGECPQGGSHEWESDGNGERYCVKCKEDHPANPKKPKATAAKYLGGIAATVAKCRCNIDDVVREFGRHKLTDQIMADLDKAHVALKKWEASAK